MAAAALCRQTLKVGAVCPNWARTDLGGGREVTRVPTAIVPQTSGLRSEPDPERTWLLDMAVLPDGPMPVTWIYDLAILRPCEVGRLRRFRIERAGWVSFELALVPLFAGPEVKGPRQHYDGTRCIRMQVRHILPSRREANVCHEQAGLARIAVQDEVCGRCKGA